MADEIMSSKVEKERKKRDRIRDRESEQGGIGGGVLCETPTPNELIITPDTQTPQMVFLFQRLVPNDSHFCDACKGLEAEFQQGLNFFCKTCFDTARVKAEADGWHFTEGHS